MRKVGYFFVGWLLFGFAMNGLVLLSTGEPAGLVFGVIAVAGFVWLVRSYRTGGSGRGGPFAGTVTLRFQERLQRLDERLPEDPLDSSAIVSAWSLHLHDPEATDRLQATYKAMRDVVSEARVELETGREEPSDSAAERCRRLETKLADVQDYLRAVDLIAEREPELVETAIAEHAQAAEVLDLARRSGAATDELVAADARLQGARVALRQSQERPLDALRLAEEAERIAVEAAGTSERRRALPHALEAARSELAAARAALAAAAERHPPSALAEIRGLPSLAAEELERAAASEDYSTLGGAQAMTRRVQAHLGALERAAATARPRLEAAEEAVDAGLGRGTAAAARAAQLTNDARLQFEQEKPDWLEITALAERALRLLDESEAAQKEAPRPTSAAELQAVRERARSAREDVWAWALTTGPRAEAASVAAEHVERLLEEAERAEADDTERAAAIYARAATLAQAAAEEAESARPGAQETHAPDVWQRLEFWMGR